MLSADDEVLVHESMNELRADLAMLTSAVKERGLRVSRKKTVFMAFNFSGRRKR